MITTKTTKIEVMGFEEDIYDRMKRIPWIDIDAITNARVLVVGAGATGNEVIKNLVLCGIKNITIVDMDYVVKSNLNRCLFFSIEDAMNKVNKAMAVSSKAASMGFDVDITPLAAKIDEVDTEIFASIDLIMGCVDNIQARLYLNSMAHKYKIPYIDSGTHGLFGKVHVVIPPDTPCIECSINRSHERVIEKRYSCTGRASSVFEPKLAAEITTTAVVAAIQVREALKVICNRKDMVINNAVYYNGENHFCDEIYIKFSPSCQYHKRHVEVA